MTDDVKRIQCWSGPRNISTALMYSWRQRADTTVYDEPFYGYYLNLDDRSHPGVADVLASQSTDADVVIRDVILGPCPTPVFYLKQMAHHLRGVDRSHLAKTENLLLVRDPTEMLASLSVQLPNCDLSDTGLVESVELLDAILDTGGSPLVIESQALLRDPPGVLAKVCEHVGPRLRSGHVELAGRPQTRRRRLGTALVPQRASVDPVLRPMNRRAVGFPIASSRFSRPPGRSTNGCANTPSDAGLQRHQVSPSSREPRPIGRADSLMG